MFKKIKDLICKLLHIKECQCPEEMDPHAELYLHTPEPEIPVHTETKVKKVVCGTHSRFKRSCPTCIAAASS